MFWEGGKQTGEGGWRGDVKHPRVAQGAGWAVPGEQRTISVDSCRNQRGAWEKVLLPSVSFGANWSSLGLL